MEYNVATLWHFKNKNVQNCQKFADRLMENDDAPPTIHNQPADNNKQKTAAVSNKNNARYYVDFFVHLIDDSKLLIEIKPERQILEAIGEKIIKKSARNMDF